MTTQKKANISSLVPSDTTGQSAP